MTKWVETLCPKLVFLCFTDFKRRKYSFFSPIPSMQCCADVRATYRKQQTPQLWTERAGNGCGFFCSLKLPYFSRMSQQFCRQLSELQKWPYIPKKINSTHFFMLGCKTPGGFLSSVWLHHAYFRTIIIRMWRFRYFQCVTFSVMLNMPWHHAMWCVAQNFLFSPLLKKKTQSEKDRELNRFLGNRAVIITKIAV